MTKSELKTGMIVIMKNKDVCIVFKDVKMEWAEGDVIVKLDGTEWETFNNYNEDLTHNEKCCRDWDIMKVYKQRYALGLRGEPDYCEQHLLWERKEKKKYTYAQLREILGEEFEVVG